MERTNIYLSERELTALRRLSRQTGRPVAHLVREAVDAWLDGQGVRVVADDDWAERLGQLLDRGRRIAETQGWRQEDVDRDVAEAVAEVRRMRRARSAGRR
jgi:hypothetical protein